MAGHSPLELGKAFLAENATQPGVITTASGLQYLVLQEGTGKSPTLKDTVVVHYRGTLIKAPNLTVPTVAMNLPSSL